MGTTDLGDGNQHAAIRFTKEGADFISTNASCVIEGLTGDPKHAAEVIVRQFDDIAMGAKADGSIDKMVSKGLQTFMRRVANGEVAIIEEH